MVDTKLSLTNNLNTNNNLKRYINSNKTYQKLYKIALRLEGLKRHTTIHAAGIVMCRCELDKVIPLYKSRDNFYLTGYSMKYLEPLGLLKMDFLALKNLTLIHNILRLIKKYEFVDINFDNIPLDDYEATNIFKTTNTVGIFQFESSGMMNFLRKLKASSFADINAAIALFRPGPMGNIDTYIKRKQGTPASVRQTQAFPIFFPGEEPDIGSWKKTSVMDAPQNRRRPIKTSADGYSDLLRAAHGLRGGAR